MYDVYHFLSLKPCGNDLRLIYKQFQLEGFSPSYNLLITRLTRLLTMTTATMRAWQYSRTSGGFEKHLRMNSSAPVPMPSENEALIQVHAMPLNPVDYKVTEGPTPLRFFGSVLTPGCDFCGKIVRIGKYVKSLEIDDLLFGAKIGSPADGTLAQYVAVPEHMLVRLPKGVQVDTAASIGIAGLTEYQAIVPHVKKSDKVFINGGSGGTGVFGIQIAKAIDCHVTTTCSATNIKLCKQLGADEVIDYTSVNIIDVLKNKGKIFDHVVDNIGTP
jgi:alkaline phosphatase D